MWQAREPPDSERRSTRGLDGNQEDHEKVGDPNVLYTITCNLQGSSPAPSFITDSGLLAKGELRKPTSHRHAK